jgi:hypothetical protein
MHGANTPGLTELRQYQQSRNPLEKVREFEFGEQSGGDNFRTAFEQLVKPRQGYSSVSSESSNVPQVTVAKGVPETTQTAILDLYQSGKKRKDIQEILDLNGDEYWMVKAVCDARDRSANGGL